jgi:hypothetical protein
MCYLLASWPWCVCAHLCWRFPCCRGAELEGCTYRHPLFDRVSPLVIGGDYITTESGTGLVHTAPGHGQEDYQVGAAGFVPAAGAVCCCAAVLLYCGALSTQAGAPSAGRHVPGWCTAST